MEHEILAMRNVVILKWSTLECSLFDGIRQLLFEYGQRRTTQGQSKLEEAQQEQLVALVRRSIGRVSSMTRSMI
jgi:hypothetical protein